MDQSWPREGSMLVGADQLAVLAEAARLGIVPAADAMKNTPSTSPTPRTRRAATASDRIVKMHPPWWDLTPQTCLRDYTSEPRRPVIPCRILLRHSVQQGVRMPRRRLLRTDDIDCRFGTLATLTDRGARRSCLVHGCDCLALICHSGLGCSQDGTNSLPVPSDHQAIGRSGARGPRESWGSDQSRRASPPQAVAARSLVVRGVRRPPRHRYELSLRV